MKTLQKSNMPHNKHKQMSSFFRRNGFEGLSDVVDYCLLKVTND